MLFNHKDSKDSNPSAPSEPPSYEQSQGNFQDGQQNYQEPPPDFAPHPESQYQPQYANLGPNEYPEEKKGYGDDQAPNGYNGQRFEQNGYNAQNYGQNGYSGPDGQGNTGIPPGTYVVPPQTANIAYDTQGTSARPGYKEYLEHDNQRIAQGDVPKPRSYFGRKGAPLAPSKKGGSGGGFPGSSGSTYYNSSK